MEVRRVRAVWGILACVAAAVGATSCKEQGASEATPREQFSSMCARCHGQDGSGTGPSAGGGLAPRNFNDKAFQAARSDAELERSIREGKAPGMPPFGGTLSESEIKGLVQVVRAFAEPPAATD